MAIQEFGSRSYHRKYWEPYTTEQLLRMLEAVFVDSILPHQKLQALAMLRELKRRAKES